MITKKNYKLKQGSNQYTRFFDLKKLLSKPKFEKDEEFSRETIFARPTKKPIKHKKPNRAKGGESAYIPTKPPVQWRHTDNIVMKQKGDPYLEMSDTSDHHQKHDPVCYNVMREPSPSIPDEPPHMGMKVLPLARGIRISICVEHTRFPLVGRVAKNMGLTHVPEHRLWNIQWSDNTPHFDLLKGMKRFQQINHFPGMSEICRKDMLALNLNRMFKMFPGDYRIFPKTWLLPSE